MKNNFTPNSIETNTNVLAAYLPEGRIYESKNVTTSNFHKLLKSFSQEYTRIQSKINELSVEYDMRETYELIEEWEKVLGIPDECFSIDGLDIKQRRLQCIVKFAQMNIQTEDDFIQLAKTLGYKIEILHGIDYSIFPMTFPILLGTAKQARFTMIVKFLDLNKPQNVFPMTFPFEFQKENPLICVFEHLKPANVRIIYWYKDYP